MNDYRSAGALARIAGAAQDYIEALEEELGHQGVGGPKELKELRKKWQDARLAYREALDP